MVVGCASAWVPDVIDKICDSGRKLFGWLLAQFLKAELLRAQFLIAQFFMTRFLIDEGLFLRNTRNNLPKQ